MELRRRLIMSGWHKDLYRFGDWVLYKKDGFARFWFSLVLLNPLIGWKLDRHKPFFYFSMCRKEMTLFRYGSTYDTLSIKDMRAFDSVSVWVVVFGLRIGVTQFNEKKK